ncbi:MAG: polysaccharide ABC transporter ATP-binding protein [Flavobacteriales bacterium]|nr:polysaccharide ABC transporter ATP-binding protein [Flavobacteriales bacterium]
MSKKVIEVNGLGKKFRIGLRIKRSDSLVGELWNIIKYPYENYKRIKSLSQFSKPDDSIFWALKDISFSVEPGEVLGIIGHNGAGKSTLLKILSRITEPSEGEVIIRGRIASLLEVGTGFHPELTGRENIYMNGTILGMRKKEVDRNLDSIVEFSGIENYLDTPIKFYSSGMKVRLGFAVAAHLEPEILVVDEVLAVGDMGFQQKCIGKMNEVARSGRTVLFVSHNMAAIQNLCTRALLLSHGQLKSIGEVKKVIWDYMNEFQREKENLIAVSNRLGSGQIRLTKFEVRDACNREISSIYSGQPVKFFFHAIRHDCEFNELIDVGFSIHHAEDDRLVSIFYSSYVGTMFPSDKDEIIYICDIEDLNLAEGRYLMRAQLMSRQQIVDYPVAGVGFIEVVEIDYYGTGIKSAKLTRDKPSMLIRGTWHT